MATEIPPNQTIYVNNLNEKVKLDDLKRELQAIFAQFGKIKDIVCMSGMIRNNPKPTFRKGQAWVVFETVESAKKALTQMQGFPFHDKQMKIAFSKNKSDIVAKEDGTFVKREKRKVEPPPAAPQPAAPQPGQPSAIVQPPAPKRQTVRATQQNEPHNILFAQGLPDECTDQMLTMLFSQYMGYKEVRLIAAKNVAFIEFADSIQSGIAMQNLNGFQLTPDHAMSVSYARK